MGSTTITIVWADGREEEILCSDWNRNHDGMIVICVNSVTREYRYIVESNVREIRTGGANG